jgi:pimeloyl-ACP methyl ester carboxylesterase
MATFLLIHGAMGGAWCWERVIPGLRAAGHAAVAIDLPGQGADATPLAEITLPRYAEAVCDALDGMNGVGGPVLLTGHSMGGMVITQAASQRPEKLAGLVYVAAFLPGPGQSLLDITHLPEAAGDSVQANLVIEGDPPVSSMPRGADRLGPAPTRPPAGDPLHPALHAAGRRYGGVRRVAAGLRHVPAGPGDPAGRAAADVHPGRLRSGHRDRYRSFALALADRRARGRARWSCLDLGVADASKVGSGG